MQAIRKRIKAENCTLNIAIPKALRDMELDVIILPAEPLSESEKKLDPVHYKGALKVDLTNEEIDRDIDRGRDEWERPIS